MFLDADGRYGAHGGAADVGFRSHPGYHGEPVFSAPRWADFPEWRCRGGEGQAYRIGALLRSIEGMHAVKIAAETNNTQRSIAACPDTLQYHRPLRDPPLYPGAGRARHHGPAHVGSS